MLDVLDPQNALTDRSPTAPSDIQNLTSDPESSSQPAVRPSARFSNMAATFERDADDVDSSDDELTLRMSIEKRIKHLSLATHPPQFLGKSSGLSFLQTALDVKEAYVNGESSTRKPVQIQLVGTRPEFWGKIPVRRRRFPPSLRFAIL